MGIGYMVDLVARITNYVRRERDKGREGKKEERRKGEIIYYC
jgi:hypothetical protein